MTLETLIGAYLKLSEQNPCALGRGSKKAVEIFAGKVVELGKQYAVPTPVNETLYRILRITEQYLK
jgi:ketopantoate reductase